MSLHRDHGDVEENEIFSISTNSDVQRHNLIELMKYSFYKNSRPSSPAMTTIHPKNSSSKEIFNDKLKPRVRSLFAG